MTDIHNEIEILLSRDWDTCIKESIMNMQKNIKSYSFLLTRSTCKDIHELIKLANYTKSEFEATTERMKELEVMCHSQMKVIA